MSEETRFFLKAISFLCIGAFISFISFLGLVDKLKKEIKELKNKNEHEKRKTL